MGEETKFIVHCDKEGHIEKVTDEAGKRLDVNIECQHPPGIQLRAMRAFAMGKIICTLWPPGFLV